MQKDIACLTRALWSIFDYLSMGLHITAWWSLVFIQSGHVNQQLVFTTPHPKRKKKKKLRRGVNCTRTMQKARKKHFSCKFFFEKNVSLLLSHMLLCITHVKLSNACFRTSIRWCHTIWTIMCEQWKMGNGKIHCKLKTCLCVSIAVVRPVSAICWYSLKEEEQAEEN